MQEKELILQNKGMNRDLSISKADKSSAYENFNIRITASDYDTLLSVTNERGTEEIALSTPVVGNLIGWNVLNEYIILFTTTSGINPDRIYRIKKEGDTYTNLLLFHGDLGFDINHPIESVVHFETEKIQKIYWLDGINPLRMMNICADTDEMALWNAELDAETGKNASTYFDANRRVNFGVQVSIEKDNTGNVRPNGVIQYLLTYYNKHGQETGYAWISDLIYLSPVGIGGGADGTNNNKITLTISNWDTRFTNFRIYSIFRSSYNGTPVANLVADDVTDYGNQSSIRVIDDYSNLSSVDPSSLLFLGSQPVVFGTMAQKDETLFLGDITYTDRGDDLTEFGDLIKNNMIFNNDHFIPGTDWESTCISFRYSNDGEDDIPNIEYDASRDTYSDSWQLGQSSSVVTTFKGGEKYRFGLVFRNEDGSSSDVFWIGDSENSKYPVIANGYIKRVVVECTIPAVVVNAAKELGFVSVRLVIAEASYADRSVKAQGILNPTMFNVWSRYQNRLYSMPSWISRPRNIDVPSGHFMPVGNSTTSIGEIECNYWENDTPTPYYTIKNYSGENPEYSEIEQQEGIYDYIKIVYGVYAWQNWFNVKYRGRVFVAKVKLNGADDFSFSFNSDVGRNALQNAIAASPNAVTISLDSGAEVVVYASMLMDGASVDQKSREDVFSKLNNFLITQINVDSNFVIDWSMFDDFCGYAMFRRGKQIYFWNSTTSNADTGAKTDAVVAFDAENWIVTGNITPGINPGKNTDSTGTYAMSYYKKQFMFLDENVVTLDSPELSYEANLFDNVEGYRLRIVGMASVDSCISDTSLDASHGMASGKNFVNDRYSGVENSYNLNGALAWPMWQDYVLREKDDIPDVIENRTAANYIKGGSIVRYWIRAWMRSGVIDGWTDSETTENTSEVQGEIREKVFANLRYSYNTVYNQSIATEWDSALDSLRIFNSTSSQYMRLSVGEDNKYYDGVIDDVLTPPGSNKYPILFSEITTTIDSEEPIGNKKLYSGSPVPITYASNPHAVLALPSVETTINSKTYYQQTVLPRVIGDRTIDNIPEASSVKTGAIIPWLEENDVDVRYITWAHDLPEDFIIDYWDQERNIVSLRREMQSYGQPDQDDYNDLFVGYCWARAVDDYADIPIWCRVKAHVENSAFYVWFLVDISGYVLYHPDPDLADHDTLRIVMAEVKDAVSVDGEEKYRNVKWTSYPDSAADKTEHGMQSLAIKSGQMSNADSEYPYVDYLVDRNTFSPFIDNSAIPVSPGGAYYLIGEIYYDYGSGSDDKRYGGITDADIKSNKFVFAGPQYELGEANEDMTIYGNQGDTYFQRWNDLRIKPLSGNTTNNMIDIISFMVETHVNLDGNFDLQKSLRNISGIDVENYGRINRVYSQPDNFFTSRDLDVDFDLNSYKSSLTWTLEKHDSAKTDEWMHITLASSLKLDGDKGELTALRRFQNSIIAFQPKGISEILFNSRTQVSTTEGVPIEIANSGKVDGKRYITNKYGSTNKWSITEGKTGLFFVDNYNKSFCTLTGNDIENLSTKLGFSSWFLGQNEVGQWTPSFDNFVSFYDKHKSEVYLLKNDSTYPCLVYNEVLGTFSSFYDYHLVPMITNVEDDLIAFKRVNNTSSLWRMHAGQYCNFFGNSYPFWMTYRAMPDSLEDKIWTNIEYRADFFTVLDGANQVSEQALLQETNYIPGETFDSFMAWNEYQSTGEFSPSQLVNDSYPDVRKKFRVWRLDIPRAEINVIYNKYGLNRMRNPWLQFTLKKNNAGTGDLANELMQLHDVTVKYFE